MKNIAVLIDFTPGSRVALNQGISFAQKSGAKLFTIHIVSSTDKMKQAENELMQFVAQSNAGNIVVQPMVEIGALAVATNSAVTKTGADLLIICTHGVNGMFQQLFGAQILKLVQVVNCTCLVVSENTKTDLSGVQKILFPAGPHPDFIVKIRETASLAKLLSAKITIYWIDKPGSDFDNQMVKNIEVTKEYFTKESVPYEVVVEEPHLLSVGFSRQTIEYAKTNGFHLMSMMANVSKNDIIFGFGDKENFLVNNSGLGILTCNA